MRDDERYYPPGTTDKARKEIAKGRVVCQQEHGRLKRAFEQDKSDMFRLKLKNDWEAARDTGRLFSEMEKRDEDFSEAAKQAKAFQKDINAVVNKAWQELEAECRELKEGAEGK